MRAVSMDVCGWRSGTACTSAAGSVQNNNTNQENAAGVLETYVDPN